MNTEVHKPRILRLIARMNVGGPAIQVTNLMKKLPEESFEQILLTGFCSNNEIDFLETRKVDLNVKRIKYFKKAINPISDLIAFIQICVFMRRYKPDIIHTHTFKAGLLGRIAAFFCGRKAKCIHTFHGHLLSGYYGVIGTKLIVWVEKVLALRSARLVTVGRRVRDELIHSGIGKPEQYVVINPGFDLDTSKKIERSEIGLPLTSFVCGWFGRIAQIKRLDRVLEIAAECKSRGMDTAFLIVGDGELRSIYEVEAKEKHLPIYFLGWRHDVVSLIRNCQVVLCTSDNEGTPISLIEAQLLGKPVITTNVGSVSEIVIPGVTGFLLDYTPSAFSQRISLLKENGALYEEFSKSAGEFAHGTFTIEKFLDKHTQIYKELLSIKPR